MLKNITKKSDMKDTVTSKVGINTDFMIYYPPFFDLMKEFQFFQKRNIQVKTFDNFGFFRLSERSGIGDSESYAYIYIYRLFFP